MAEERVVDFPARAVAARSPAVIEQLHTAAQSMLTTRQVLRSTMPAEFVHCPSLDLLLTLFVADHQTLAVAELREAGLVASHVASRWIEVFVQRGLVTLRDTDAMLTEGGFKMIADACQAVIEAQPGGCPTRLH